MADEEVVKSQRAPLKLKVLLETFMTFLRKRLPEQVVEDLKKMAQHDPDIDLDDAYERLEVKPPAKDEEEDDKPKEQDERKASEGESSAEAGPEEQKQVIVQLLQLFEMSFTRIHLPWQVVRALLGQTVAQPTRFAHAYPLVKWLEKHNKVQPEAKCAESEAATKLTESTGHLMNFLYESYNHVFVKVPDHQLLLLCDDGMLFVEPRRPYDEKWAMPTDKAKTAILGVSSMLPCLMHRHQQINSMPDEEETSDWLTPLWSYRLCDFPDFQGQFEGLDLSLDNHVETVIDYLTEDDKMEGVRVCEICLAPQTVAALKVCGKCNGVWYCSREHQRQGWEAHKPDCVAGKGKGGSKWL